MTLTDDPLVFDVSPRNDTTGHGPKIYSFNLTALRDGYAGRVNMQSFRGDPEFGLALGLTIKGLIIRDEIGKHVARDLRQAAYYLMRFLDTQVDGTVEPSHRMLVDFADYLKGLAGRKPDSLLSDAARIRARVSKILEEMCPGINIPRGIFAKAHSLENVRKMPIGYVVAEAAYNDFKRVRDRIAEGKYIAESPGESTLEYCRQAGYPRDRVLRLLKNELNYCPISGATFKARFGIRPDHHFHFPGPGRVATVGSRPARSGLAATFRWVLPTATDLLGPVVLTLENTGWNQATILNMKASMVEAALLSARDGRTRIFSYKGRARHCEKADILTGERSLLRVLETALNWTAPLRASITGQLPAIDSCLEQAASPGEFARLLRRKSELEDMKDRLWLYMSTKTIGTSALCGDDVSRPKLEAMLRDNDANMALIGKYNFREARLHFMARIQSGADVTVELLRAIASHTSASTTESHYAQKLPSSLSRDSSLHTISEGVMWGLPIQSGVGYD